MIKKKNKALKKLRQNNGETLIETLMGVMIACLAMAALVTCITTAVNLIRDSKVRMAAYYDANNHVAVQGAEADAEGTLVIKNAQDQVVELIEGHDQYDIEYFINQKDDRVVSFRKAVADDNADGNDD